MSDETTSAVARLCMPCTACCAGWLSASVLGQTIAAGKPCQYSTAKGCGVYDERPDVPCRSYMCSWIIEESPLPDWMRPDLGGAIVLLSMPWHGEKVISAIPAGQLIPERALNWLMAYAQKHRRPLIYYERIMDKGEYSGLRAIGFGPPEFREKVARLAPVNESLALSQMSEPG